MKTKTLRVMSINVHVGKGLTSGAVGALMGRIPGIHVVCVQEASRKPARAAMEKNFPAKKWVKVGPIGQLKDPLVGTFVCARRNRLKLLKKINKKVSAGTSARYPQRNLVAGTFFDKATGRETVISCIHNWQIVGRSLSGKGSVMTNHIKQTEAIADYHSANFVQGQVHLSAGDTNERLDDKQMQRHEKSFSRTMARALMMPSYEFTKKGSREVTLDDVFFRPTTYIRVKRRRVIPRFGVFDHDIVITTFTVAVAD